MHLQLYLVCLLCIPCSAFYILNIEQALSQVQAGDEVFHQLVAQVLEGLKVGKVVFANGAAGQNRIVAGEEDVYTNARLKQSIPSLERHCKFPESGH